MNFVRRPTNWNPVREVEFADLAEFVSVLRLAVKPGDPSDKSQCYRHASLEFDQQKLCKHIGVDYIPIYPMRIAGGLYDTDLKGWHFIPAAHQGLANGHLSDALFDEAVRQKIIREERPINLL